MQTSGKKKKKEGERECIRQIDATILVLTSIEGALRTHCQRIGHSPSAAQCPLNPYGFVLVGRLGGTQEQWRRTLMGSR